MTFEEIKYEVRLTATQINDYLNLAKKNPSQASEWLASLNLNQETFLVSLINSGYASYLPQVLNQAEICVSAKVLISACKKGQGTYLPALCKKAEITRPDDAEAVLVAVLDSGLGSYLPQLLNIRGMCVSAKVLITACQKRQGTYLSSLCKNAEVTSPDDAEAVLVAVLDSGLGSYLPQLLNIRGMCVSAKVLITACQKRQGTYLSSLCKNAEVTSPDDAEAVLVAVLDSGLGSYLPQLLNIKGMSVSARVLITACQKRQGTYLSSLCKNAEITSPDDAEAVLIAALDSGLGPYLPQLLNIKGMSVSARVLIRACQTGQGSYLPVLCKHAKIADPKDGEAVLIAAIDRNYALYVSRLLQVKGIEVNHAVIHYAIKHCSMYSLYVLFPDIKEVFDEGIEQAFNARVIALGHIKRRMSELAGHVVDINDYTTSEPFTLFMNGTLSYDKDKLNKVCFNSEMLAEARSNGIFGKEFLKDCLWTQLQNSLKSGSLHDWLDGSLFTELLDLLVLFKDQIALNRLLSLLIKEQCAVHHITALSKAGAESPDDLKFAINAGAKPLVEHIMAHQAKNTVYYKFMAIGTLFSEPDYEKLQIYAEINDLRSDFIEKYELEKAQIKTVDDEVEIKPSVQWGQSNENDLIPELPNKSMDMSMMVLGGFITAIGCAAVALAVTVLNVATFGSLALVVAGVVTGAVGIGFFAASIGKSNQPASHEVDDIILNSGLQPI